MDEEKKERNPLLPESDKLQNENNLNENSLNSKSEEKIIEISNKETELFYFNFLGKKRRFPPYKDQSGFITSLIMILMGSLFYLIMLYLLLTEYDKERKIIYLILLIITSITLIITLFFLFIVTTSIPGYQTGEKITEKEFTQLSPTKTIKNKTFILKYCNTCHLIRNIRTFHCKICGICIERHDHHCSFISNCIGKKNHKLFFFFLIILFIHLIPIVCVDGYVFMIITDLEKKMDDKKNIITISLLAGITIVFAGFFLCFSITMIITHIQLISNNQVSNEIIRKKDDNKDVFNKGCCGNWKEVFCDN